MILNSEEKGSHTGKVLIDLQKTFDTLGNEIPQDKMKCIVFSGQWLIGTYSRKEKNFVSLDTILSNMGDIN